MPRLLLIDKDVRLAAALSAALRRTGYQVQHVQTAAAAPAGAAWDLVLMDPAPTGTGPAWCRTLRGRSGAGIVVLTGNNAERDRVAALRSGADDYITKPFRFAELHARLEAVLHRVRPPTREVLETGPLRVDLGGHLAAVDGTPVDLTPKELQVLALLARSPGTVVGRDELLATVWPGTNGSGSRSLDVHITTLRSKLGPPIRIEAVRGVGYRLAGTGSPADPTSGARRLVVISPHFHHAVLSTGGRILRSAGQATVVTVFGGVPARGVPPSEQDRRCGFTSATEAAQARAGEDVRACQELDASTIHLRHLDGDDPGNFDSLTALVAGLSPQETVLLPAGIGDDPVHLRVRDAALAALAGRPDQRVGLYADGYADDCGRGPRLPGTSVDLTPQRIALTGDEWQSKRRGACAYASQMGVLTNRVPELLAYPGPLQHETVWWLGEP